MKLLIAGSRGIGCFDLTPYVSKEVDLIISGGAVGVDAIAEQFADSHKISRLVVRPRYDLFKRNAPLKRNEQMVDLSDEVLVIWDGKSKGSLHTIKYAQKKNKPLTVVMVTGVEGGSDSV